MGAACSTAAKNDAVAPVKGAVANTPSTVSPVSAPAAAPAAKPAVAAKAKSAGPWTTGTGIQFWSASPSHRDPITVSGDLNCKKGDLKKVVVLLDPRHISMNMDFVKKVRATLFKHKERTHGAADWNAVDTSAGYSADLKIRTLLITPSPNSDSAFCTAIETGLQGMAVLNYLIGTGWKGADTMLKLALADDFYADPDGVLYKLYGQYDAAGNGGKSSAWKAYCSLGLDGVNAIKALKEKFEKDVWPKRAYTHLALSAGLEEAEIHAGMQNLVDYISNTVPTAANVANAKSTTRDAKEQPAEKLTEHVKNVSWPSNRRPVAFCMSTSSHSHWSQRFARFERPCFDVSVEIPDGEAPEAADVANKMIVEKVANAVEGHHQRKPIVIVGADSLDSARLARFSCLMNAMQANESCKGVTVVVHASAYETFQSNKLVATVLAGALKQASAGIVCMTDELDRVIEMFLAPSNEAIVDSIKACMVPFPDMHLFTTHNALGQAIQDHEILTTEFMVGNPGTGKTGAHLKKIFERQLPLEKFAASKTRNLVLSDLQGNKKVHRLRMATKYDYNLKPISLIMPSQVLATLLRGCADGADEVAAPVLTGYADTIVRVAEGGDF